jgi:CheY-like chemotaxis protein
MAANEAVLAPGRGRRVLISAWERIPRTLIFTLPEKVCSALVESRGSVDALDVDEVELNNLILGFCNDCVREVLGNAAAPQSIAPLTISRSAVAIAFMPGAMASSTLINTNKGAVGLTCITAGASQTAARSDGSQRKRVLIVDDDGLARKLIAKAVADLDIEFSAVESGAEALAAVAELGPHLVLLDYEMPVMNGHECLLRMRQLSASIQVIMVTARGTADVVKKCVEGGAAGFIVKPFRVIDLQDRVRKALGLPDPIGVA